MNKSIKEVAASLKDNPHAQILSKKKMDLYRGRFSMSTEMKRKPKDEWESFKPEIDDQTLKKIKKSNNSKVHKE